MVAPMNGNLGYHSLLSTIHHYQSRARALLSPFRVLFVGYPVNDKRTFIIMRQNKEFIFEQSGNDILMERTVYSNEFLSVVVYMQPTAISF